MTDETIAKLVSGEWQDVHVFLRAEDGTECSALYPIGMRVADLSFDVDRIAMIEVTKPGAGVYAIFETADGAPILAWSVTEWGSTGVVSPGQTFKLAPNA